MSTVHRSRFVTHSIFFELGTNVLFGKGFDRFVSQRNPIVFTAVFGGDFILKL